MIIYLHGSPDKLPVAEHTVIIAPAAHLPMTRGKDGKAVGNELPEEFWDHTGQERQPANIPIKFRYGEAEVSNEVGRYMLDTGQAQKHRLVLPNSWNR